MLLCLCEAVERNKKKKEQKIFFCVSETQDLYKKDVIRNEDGVWGVSQLAHLAGEVTVWRQGVETL